MKVHKRNLFIILFSSLFILNISIANSQTNYIVKENVSPWETVGSNDIEKPLSGVVEGDYSEYGSSIEIKFDVSAGEEYIYGSSDEIFFDFNIKFSLTAYNKDNEIIEMYFDDSEYSATLNNDQPEYSFHKDLDNNVYEIKLTINDVTETAGTSTIVNIKQKLSFISKYGYITTPQNPDNLEVNTENLHLTEFSWNHDVQGYLYNSYQLQILRLYNIDQTNFNTDEITPKIDWSQAFTVEVPVNPVLSGKNINFKIAEGTGFYVWRVRPIGTYYPGGIANSDNWGKWSDFPPNITAPPYNTYLKTNITSPFFYYTDTEEDLNRIYSRIFTEDFKTKETAVYANGLQQVYQSQVYIPSTNTTIITGGIYDHSGKQALNIMPVPFQGQYLAYKDRFLKDANGNLYTADNINPEDGIPGPVKTEGTHFEYYNHNTENIAGIGTHPFASSVFYNDPLGRVKEQGGIGETFKLGEKTVKTYYSIPSETELIRLFGDEAPKSESVQKITTVDQNNIATVTYTSLQGKVIATCLSFTEGGNLEEIDGYENIEELTVQDIVTENIKSKDDIISTKRLAFLNETDVNFSYIIYKKDIEQGCKTLNCNYELKFMIFDVNENEIIAESDILDIDFGAVPGEYIEYNNDESPTGDIRIMNLRFIESSKLVEHLQAGTYIITKTLTPDSGILTDNEEEIQKEIYPVTNAIMFWLDMVIDEQWTYDDFVDVIYVFQCYLGYIPSNGVHHTDLKDFYDEFGCTGINSFEFVSIPITDVAELLDDAVDTGNRNSYELLNCDPEPEDAGDFICLNTPCCTGIQIDITRPYTCQTVENGCDYGTDADMTFEKFARDYLGTCTHFAGTGFQTNFLNYYMPGWEIPGTFDAMINEMLKERKLNEIGEITDIPLYTCSHLFSCWRSLLAKVKADHANCGNLIDFPDEPDITNPVHISEQYDGKEGEGDPSHDDHFDESLEEAGVGWLIRKWIGMVLHRKMRKNQDKHFPGTPPGAPANESYEQYHLVYEFLECTGYQFERIFTPYSAEPVFDPLTSNNNDCKLGFDYTNPIATGTGTPVYPSNIPEDAVVQNPFEINMITPSGSTNCFSNYYAEYLEIDTDGNNNYFYVPIQGWNASTILGTDPEPLFPNIHNPVFAYKYYNYDNVGGDEFLALETNTCFSDPNICYKVKEHSNGYFIATIDGQPDIFDCCSENDYSHGGFCFEENGKYYVRNFEGMGGGIKCTQTHINWNNGQRYTFWKQLASFEPVPKSDFYTYADTRNSCSELITEYEWYELISNNENCDIPYPYINDIEANKWIGGTWWNPDDCEQGDLLEFPSLDGETKNSISLIEIAMVDKKDGCISTCENRENMFYQKLRETFLDSCYQIVTCYDANTSPDNHITEEQIHQIAQQLVNNCINQCDLLTFSCDDGESFRVRPLDTPKYLITRKEEPVINYGVAGIPDNYSDCEVGSLSGYKDNAPGYFISNLFGANVRQYSFNPDNGYGIIHSLPNSLTWYEYTRIRQATIWDFDISIESKCPGNEDQIRCIDCDPENTGTFVEKNEYETYNNIPQPNNIPAVTSPWVKKEIVTGETKKE